MEGGGGGGEQLLTRQLAPSDPTPVLITVQ